MNPQSLSMCTFLTRSLLVLLFLSQPACQTPSEESVSTEVAVEMGKVVRTTLHAYLNTYGSVMPEPAGGGRQGGAANLNTPVAGLVRAVIVSEGQAVRAGDLVVRLEDRMAQADVDRAVARLHFAKQTLAREQTLLDQHNASQKQFDEAQLALALARADLTTAEGVLDQVQLRSPIDGVVSRINVLPGQSIDLNTVVAEIVDIRRLVVLVQVPVEETKLIKTGQKAFVELALDDRANVTAYVSYVNPAVDPISGTVSVRLSLPADSGLRPGTFVRVKIIVEEHRERLAVPLESVYTSADGQSTLSIVKNDTAFQKVVHPGLQDGSLIEVEGEDLQEGLTVVTIGSYALPEKTLVRRLSDKEGEEH